jgi:hypothetical protein
MPLKAWVEGVKTEELLELEVTSSLVEVDAVLIESDAAFARASLDLGCHFDGGLPLRDQLFFFDMQSVSA